MQRSLLAPRRARLLLRKVGRAFARYGQALLVVVLAIAVLSIPMVNDRPGTPPLVAFVAILLAAWFGGFGPGIFALALILVVTSGPDFTLWRQLRFALLVLSGVMICAVIESLHAARRRARAHAETLAAVLRGSVDHIYVVDRRGRYVCISDGAARVLGRSPEEVIGRTWAELGLPAEIMEPFDVRRELVLATERPIRDEVPFDAPDGRRYFEYIITPIREAGADRAESVVVVSRDVTDRRRAENDLREADRRKDEFLAMLAHELRNPLSAIGHAVQVARRDDESQAAWSRGVIERQVKHLARLIDDLLDVSRITRGKVLLRRKPVEIGAIIAAAMESARPLIEARRHHLTGSAPDEPLWVEGDATRLEQVVANLLTNAAKYTEAGGRIGLGWRREGGQVAIRVRDNGVGLTADQIPRMFELFAQGDRSLARSEGGLGIGLTLAKSLAEMHGGSLSATSDGPGRGSEFVIRLPVATPPAEAGDRASSVPARGGGRCGRVLVVDDNPDAARGMARLLALLGHEVRSASDGPAALEMAREFRPDRVVLDIGLPGMDGYQVAERLRSEPWSDGLVLIAVSGYGQDEDRRRSREAGIDHHLVKPVDHDALISLLSA